MVNDNLVQAVLDEGLRLAGGADNAKRTRAREALNRAQAAWASKLPWSGLRRTEDFTHPGGRTMGFPARVARIIAMVDIAAGQQVESLDHWSSQSPVAFSQGTAGSPVKYRPAGTLPVVAAPSTDSQLTFEAGGSEAMNVRVSGLRRDAGASGSSLEFYEDRETLVMGGTDPTVSSKSYVSIISLEKDENTDFDLKVSETVAGTVLARIPAWASRAEYQAVDFLFVPPVGSRFRVDYFIRPEKIGSEQSVLDASIDHEYLVWAVAADVLWGLGKRQDAQIGWAKADSILETRITAERTFGEVDLRTVPGLTYQEMEDYIG